MNRHIHIPSLGITLEIVALCSAITVLILVVHLCVKRWRKRHSSPDMRTMSYSKRLAQRFSSRKQKHKGGR